MRKSIYRDGPYPSTRSLVFFKVRKILRFGTRWTARIVVAGFFTIGLVFTAVFVGMHYGLFNVKGSISERNTFYGNLTKVSASAATSTCTNHSMIALGPTVRNGR